MGKIQKEGKWILHELSELAIQNCLTICTSLFSRYEKKFLYQIITGDEKQIYYDNFKKSWVPGHSLTSKCNTHGSFIAGFVMGYESRI